METIGVRELKAHLSRQLRRVRSGTRLTITEHGRPVAVISPIEESAVVEQTEWAHRMVAEGRARWNGQKPSVTTKRTVLKGRRLASDIVIEDRR